MCICRIFWGWKLKKKICFWYIEMRKKPFKNLFWGLQIFTILEKSATDLKIEFKVEFLCVKVALGLENVAFVDNEQS